MYLAPTRALAADQLNLLHAIGGQPARGLGLRPAVVDSDTPHHQRAWARRHATYLLTTPDMLHYGLLPQHQGAVCLTGLDEVDGGCAVGGGDHLERPGGALVEPLSETVT